MLRGLVLACAVCGVITADFCVLLTVFVFNSRASSSWLLLGLLFSFASGVEVLESFLRFGAGVAVADLCAFFSWGKISVVIYGVLFFMESDVQWCSEVRNQRYQR